MNGASPAESYVRFGLVQVPGVVLSDYPGPTIKLASSTGTAKGTYLGTEFMPTPEPIPLSVAFTPSNEKPGTLADYTFVITTTGDIFANYNLLVEAIQVDPATPHIEFKETTATKINVSVKIGTGSTQVLTEA